MRAISRRDGCRRTPVFGLLSLLSVCAAAALTALVVPAPAARAEAPAAVGSPAENLTLRDIPGTKEFVFQRPESGERRGDLGIANLHPRENEPRYFFGSPGNTQLTEDYAVIALVKGLDPAHSVLIMAGTTTMGTQAAVEFACDENSLHELLQRIHADASGVKPFEAVLHVKVTRGVPVETTIAAVRSTQ